MRITAKDLDKHYELKIKDPGTGGIKRVTKIAEIKEHAVEFAYDVLLDLDLPGAPSVQVGRMVGFENVNIPLEHVVGVVHVHASFSTLNNRRIQMDLPIPVVRGAFRRPSLVIINNKKHVLSQDLIERLISTLDYKVPKTFNYMTPSSSILWQDNAEKPMYSSPNLPMGIDLDYEDYSLF